MELGLSFDLMASSVTIVDFWAGDESTQAEGGRFDRATLVPSIKAMDKASNVCVRESRCKLQTSFMKYSGRRSHLECQRN
jgi:hypothetical protein